MGKRVKLLQKTLKPMVLYSLIVLSLSIPAYFLIINYIWLEELDEHHQIIRQQTEKEINALHLSDSALSNFIELWNRTQPRTHLSPAKKHSNHPDSLYTLLRFDKYQQERAQFRGLSAYILLNQKPYHLLIETNMEEVDETIVAIAGVTFGFFMLLLLGFIVLNRNLSLTIWRPFYHTLHQLKTFDLNSQNSLQLKKSNIQEFEELHEAIEALVEKNLAVYKQQKEFTENASHELQTPLAILKSKLDLLVQDDSLSNQQGEIIASLHLSLSRASRINKNLLLLAKIENQQYTDNEPINLSELLNQSIDFLDIYLVDKNICLEKAIQTDIKVQANKSLLEILLNNLLLNAIRHNQNEGKLHIELKDKTLVISNSGENSLNKANLFKRFSTSSSETPSSGLGLAIVQEICNRYAWQIHYKFENIQHIFLIYF